MLRFPVPRFPTVHFGPSRVFQSRVFSPPPSWPVHVQNQSRWFEREWKRTDEQTLPIALLEPLYTREAKVDDGPESR